jgi:hypothetical protein
MIKYEIPTMEIIAFDARNVVQTSGEGGGLDVGEGDADF